MYIYFISQHQRVQISFLRRALNTDNALKAESITSTASLALAELPYIILETIAQSNHLDPDCLLVNKDDWGWDNWSGDIFHWHRVRTIYYDIKNGLPVRLTWNCGMKSTINNYRQVSNIRHQIPTLERSSYCLAAVFAESLEARC